MQLHLFFPYIARTETTLRCLPFEDFQTISLNSTAICNRVYNNRAFDIPATCFDQATQTESRSHCCGELVKHEVEITRKIFTLQTIALI